MAVVFVQALGTGVGTSAATTTTIAFSGGTKPAVGESVIVACSRDNVVTDPATGDTMTDNLGNFYFRVSAVAGTTTTAAGGIVGVLFHSVVSTLWTGTVTITWTHPSVVARAFRADHFSGVGGLRIGSSATAASTVGASLSATTGATSPVSGDLVYGMTAAEYGSAAAPTTVDTDTTNGSWSTTAFIGNGTSSVSGCKAATQYKIVTASGAQTFGLIGGFGTTTAVDVVLIVASFLPTQPAISTLTDDFRSYDLAKWTTNTGTAPTVDGDRLRFLTTNPYVEVLSNIRYSLMGSSIYAHVWPDNTVSVTREFLIELLEEDTSGNNMLFFYHSDNDPVPYMGNSRVTAGSTTTNYIQPYDPTAHAWWRMREAAGTVYFDTAPQPPDPGTFTWTNRTSFDLNTLGWQPCNVLILLRSGYSAVSEVEPTYQYVDNLNLPPPATTTPSRFLYRPAVSRAATR